MSYIVILMSFTAIFPSIARLCFNISVIFCSYGDRAPRTFPGRVFAICWIMIGICICSIFTATLTSALTMNSFDVHKTITRTKVFYESCANINIIFVFSGEELSQPRPQGLRGIESNGQFQL
jgi:hypothetical protein